jgi:ABC-type siderophore export system fused ATPase/permease subunit
VSETVQTPDNTADAGNAVTGASILLDKVTKRYPGQAKAAVDGLTMEIPAGKIVMLVGPSGCGKTTTLKMINRLIEPTEGRIVLDEDDVTDIDGDALRRRIGYVIQAGGLFPHMTVATNIGIVPKMLGWSKERSLPASTSCSNWSRLTPPCIGTGSRRNFPVDSSNESVSPAPSPPIRRSSSWTSPSVRWTPSPANGFRTNS